ncbi:MAG: methyltransferase [Castellaniella sp.]
MKPSGQGVTGSAEAPQDAIRRMAGGFVMTQVLHTAVLAGVADGIGSTPCDSGELAQHLQLDPVALRRFMRMMVVLNLLGETDDGRFQLTEVGRILRADHPESMRDRILYLGAIHYPASASAYHSLKTGQPAFDHVFGLDYFSYLSQHSDLSRYFNGLMQDSVHRRISGIRKTYDFSRFEHIVDIGGGNAALLIAILSESRCAQATLFDAPGVISEARIRIADAGLERRIRVTEGDLFDGPYPQGGDLYILSNIIHDWDDERSKVILRHCRQSMGKGSTLILIEEILPRRVKESPATIANDYSMLLLTGGRERTAEEYRMLIEDDADLRLNHIAPFGLATSDPDRAGKWAIMECRVR